MAIAVRLETLKEGPKSGRVRLDAAAVGALLDGRYTPASAPLDLSWTLNMTAGVVQLNAEVTGQLRFACARCVAPLTLPVSVPVSHHWVPASDLHVDGLTEDGDFDRDPDVSGHDGEAVDLEPIVHECLLVEFPFAPDCDSSVEGRCPEWTDEARVLHPGGEAPEVPSETPFAALAGLKVTEPSEG